MYGNGGDGEIVLATIFTQPQSSNQFVFLSPGEFRVGNEEDDDARVHSEGTALAGNMYLPKWLKVASLHKLIFQYGGMDKLVLFIRRSLEKIRNKIGVHDVGL